MDKEQLLTKIRDKKYTHEQLTGWIGALPSNLGNRKPIEYKAGDVLMHSVFKHPYILLKKRKDDWLCGLLTSEETCPEVLEICQSRFFPHSYLTKVLFTTTDIQGGFLNTYGNSKHLNEVLKKLKEILK